MTLNQKQSNQIQILVGVFTILAAVTTVLIYVENKRHAKIKDEIMSLDREIKELELLKLRNGNA